MTVDVMLLHGVW